MARLRVRAKRTIAVLGVAILVAGCAGGGSQQESSHSPVPVHAAEANEPGLPVVPGYTYSDLRADQWEEFGGSAQAIIDEANSDSSECRVNPCVIGAAAHLVDGEGMDDALFLQMVVAPEYAKQEGLMQMLVAGSAGTVVSGSGGRITTEEVSGVLLSRVVGVNGGVGYIWHADGVLQIAVGEDPGTFFRATLEAEPGTKSEVTAAPNVSPPPDVATEGWQSRQFGQMSVEIPEGWGSAELRKGQLHLEGLDLPAYLAAEIKAVLKADRDVLASLIDQSSVSADTDVPTSIELTIDGPDECDFSEADLIYILSGSITRPFEHPLGPAAVRRDPPSDGEIWYDYAICDPSALIYALLIADAHIPQSDIATAEAIIRTISLERS